MILIFDSTQKGKPVAATCGVCRKALKCHQPLYLALLRGRQCSNIIKCLEPSDSVYSVISGVALAELPSHDLLSVRLPPNVLRLWMWRWADHSGRV